jgi:hypothetical protein
MGKRKKNKMLFFFPKLPINLWMKAAAELALEARFVVILKINLTQGSLTLKKIILTLFFLRPLAKAHTAE